MVSILCFAAAPLTAEAFTTFGPVRSSRAAIVLGARTRSGCPVLFTAAAEDSDATAAESEQEQPPVEHEHSEGVENPYLPSESESDILSSPAFLQRKLDVLKTDIEKAEEGVAQAKAELEAGKAEWKPKLDDLEKEARNIQERMATLSRNGEGVATVEVARVILEALENFDRAFNSITPGTDEEKAIDAAYRGTYDGLLGVLGDLGVTEVESVGMEFDYEVHNAVMVRPSEEYEEGIVCEELQKGYVLGKQLIRAAAVAVTN